jgi:F0F1-type ATP synthase assembly protein I
MPLFLILFVLLGGAAGLANLWRMVAPPGRPPSGRDG